MGFIDLTRTELNAVFTQNGDVAYRTTGSYCLDYFSMIGASRFKYNDAISLFLKAFREDKELAVKITFYLRDVRNGLGERNLFRIIFNTLAEFYPELAKQLIPYIPRYGRYDDLFCAIDTPLKNDVYDYIVQQLKRDLAAKEKGKPVSLLAKWLPSENTSSDKTRELASQLRKKMGLSHGEYRKMLTFLREGTIVETSLVNKDFSFDYSKLPGGALHQYRKAFLRNDTERYSEYLSDVLEKKEKIHAKTIYPYQIVRDYRTDPDLRLKDTYQAIWNNLLGTIPDTKTLDVLDTSGSMYDDNNPSAIDVAVSLAVLFANKLKGEFHNKFIEFSDRPQLLELPGNDLYGWLDSVFSHSEAASTDVEKVYRLIENVYSREDFRKEDELDRIVIISDMEFNELSAPAVPPKDKPYMPKKIYGSRALLSTYESFKRKFEEKGFRMPEMVYWNVRSQSKVPHYVACKDEKGVKLVSGFSANLIRSIVKNESLDPYEKTC